MYSAVTLRTWYRCICIALRTPRRTPSSTPCTTTSTSLSAEERIEDVGYIAHAAHPAVHASESTHTGPSSSFQLVLGGSGGANTFLTVLVIPERET